MGRAFRAWVGRAFRAWVVAARASGQFHCKPCAVLGCENPPLQFQDTCRKHTEPFPKMGIRERRKEPTDAR